MSQVAKVNSLQRLSTMPSLEASQRDRSSVICLSSEEIDALDKLANEGTVIML